MTVMARAGIVALAATTLGCTETGPSIDGRACIVLDLRNPAQCGARQDVGGLHVVELTTGASTETNNDGKFSVDIPETATRATLRIAEGRTDRVPSVVGVPEAPADGVLAPVITTTLWDIYLTQLRVVPDPSQGIIHVAFPAPGVVIGSARITGATQVLFNQGEPFIWGPSPPSDQIIAIMGFGVPAGTDATINIITASDQVYTVAAPVEAGAISWVRFVP